MKITRTREWNIFYEGFWKNNATFGMILGICSTLAVTNSVANGIAMGLGVIFVICASSVIVSIIRKVIPRRVRLAVYMLITATFVIFVDLIFQAYIPDISKAMGAYVGLIITNCIIMGRAESFAALNGVWHSFVDAVGVGGGYALSLVLISIIRELLGFGTLLGYPVLGEWWEPWGIMVLAPGAFIVVGVYIWILRWISPPEE